MIAHNPSYDEFSCGWSMPILLGSCSLALGKSYDDHSVVTLQRIWVYKSNIYIYITTTKCICHEQLCMCYVVSMAKGLPCHLLSCNEIICTSTSIITKNPYIVFNWNYLRHTQSQKKLRECCHLGLPSNDLKDVWQPAHQICVWISYD